MSRHYQVELTPEAERNIEEAYQWIDNEDPAAAARWYEELIQALQSLAKMPQRCPICPESRLGLIDREVRQVLHGRGYWKYRVLFIVEQRRVAVLHVRHGARLYLGQTQDEDGGE